LEANQAQLEAAEKIKATVTDLTQRIAALQKLVDGQTTEVKGYAEFYRATEVTKQKTECAIATIEKHLEKALSPEQRQCTAQVMKDEREKVDAANAALKARKDEVASLTAAYEKAVRDLTTAKELYVFMKTGMLDEIKKKLADLAKFNQFADPPKDPCLAHFYLQEMKDILANAYTEPSKADQCYPPSSLSVGTFLSCWTPECYEKTYATSVVAFNNAEYLEKCLKVELDALKKKLAEAEKTATESGEKRRDRIAAALTLKECCKKPAAVV
jgi:hypothetical protein